MPKKKSNLYLSIWKEAVTFSFSLAIYCKGQHSTILKLKKNSLCLNLIITSKFHHGTLFWFVFAFNYMKPLLRDNIYSFH